MREARALRRAAWHELWQGGLLAIGCATVLAYSISVDKRAASMWVGLWLVPAALFCGIACGRATPRMLAFMLARPARRESVLVSRMVLACALLGVAWGIVSTAIAVRDPHVGAAYDALTVAGVLLLAMISGTLGSTATDREPLALGIGTLVFFGVLTVPLVAAEALDVGLARVTASHPIGLALLIVAALVGLGRAVLLAWRERLPLRDRWMARCLVARSAGAWVIVQPFCLFVVWSSASPQAASPVAVIGADDRGAIVVGGSPPSSGGTGQWIDGVTVGIDEPLVVVDATQRNALLGGLPAADIIRAVTAGGRVAVALRERGSGECHIELGGPDGTRPIDAQCGLLSLSPSGQTLAIDDGSPIVVVDTRTLEKRGALGPQTRLDLLGWRGEDVVSWNSWEAHFFVGAKRVATVTGSVADARLSPRGDRVALRIGRDPGRHWSDSLRDSGIMFSVLSLDTGMSRPVDVGLDIAAVVGWLDPVHLAVLGSPSHDEAQLLRVIDVDTGEIVASVEHVVDIPLSWIAGPPQGPWLVGSIRPVLEAWDRNGHTIWTQPASRLEFDDHDTRRWAIIGDEVVGIDPRGRWWRHSVPWEVTP